MRELMSGGEQSRAGQRGRDGSDKHEIKKAGRAASTELTSPRDTLRQSIQAKTSQYRARRHETRGMSTDLKYELATEEGDGEKE